MARRGRPTYSLIRQQIVDILSILGEGYGYEIHKLHKQLFAPCTREVVYYHLKKGIALGEIAITRVAEEKGNYSWGPAVQKRYYGLGQKAQPNPTDDVREAVQLHIRDRTPQ